MYKSSSSGTSVYAYDTENDLTSIQDANNHTTSFTYDAFGRVNVMAMATNARGETRLHVVRGSSCCTRKVSKRLAPQPYGSVQRCELPDVNSTMTIQRRLAIRAAKIWARSRLIT